MEGNPGQREPARPVAASEHEHAAHYRKDAHKRKKDELGQKAMRRLEVGHVESKTGHARCDEYATENCNGNRPPVHALAPSAICCMLFEDFSNEPHVAEWVHNIALQHTADRDRKSTRLNSSHLGISY